MKRNDKTNEATEYKVLIVDDESLARKRIKDMLSGKTKFEIVGECSNGKDAIEFIKSGKADVVFLDIHMQDMDGFEVLRGFDPAVLPKIIFVTAYDQYALKAFEVHAIDYLLKPFDDERFEEMLEHVAHQIEKDDIQNLGSQLTSLLSDVANVDRKAVAKSRVTSNGFQKRLVIKSTGKISFVEVDEIEWIGAEGSYVSLNTNGKSQLMRGTLKKLVELLNPEAFLRIHRSTIVNVSSIQELKSHFHGEYVVILKNGKRLKLSRSYRDSAERLLGGKL